MSLSRVTSSRDRNSSSLSAQISCASGYIRSKTPGIVTSMSDLLSKVLPHPSRFFRGRPPKMTPEIPAELRRADIAY